MIWFYKDWWQFLLMRPFSWRAFFCRAKGHPAGVVWFNVSSLEPDMHCKNCGDNLA